MTETSADNFTASASSSSAFPLEKKALAPVEGALEGSTLTPINIGDSPSTATSSPPTPQRQDLLSALKSQIMTPKGTQSEVGAEKALAQVTPVARGASTTRSTPVTVGQEEQKFDKSVEKLQRPIQIVTYASSQNQVDPELTCYLQNLLKESYNKWCLDCKINKSTHAIVFFGTFVCERCATELVSQFGRAAIWPKRIFGEQWDDYQLMHIAQGAGGNKPLYLLFQEYALESCEISEKYNSKVFQWYQRHHRALIDGLPFDEERPSKTWTETWDRTKEKAKEKVQRVEDKTTNLVQRADARLFKSRTLGGIWAKIRKTDDQVDKKEQVATTANDDFEQAVKSAVDDKAKDEVSAVSICLTDENNEKPIGLDDEEDIADANTKSTIGSKLSPQKVLANENAKEAGMYHDTKV